MTVLWVAFEVLINFLQCGLTLYFGIRVFEPRSGYENEKRYVLPLWALATFLLSLHGYFSLPAWIPDILPGVIAFLVMTGYFHKGPFFQKLCWCVIYFVVIGVLCVVFREIVIRLLGAASSEISDYTFARLIYVIAVNAMLIPSTLLLIRIARYFVHGRMPLKRANYGIAVVFLALPLGSLYLLICMSRAMISLPEPPAFTIHLGIAAVALLFVIALVIWVFDHIRRQNENVMFLNVKNERMALQLRYYEDIERLHQDTLAWQHDKEKHLKTLLALAEMKQHDKVTAYLRKLTEQDTPLPIRYATGNVTVDALLNAFGALFVKDGIRFTVRLTLPPTLPIPYDDMVILLGNLIENAGDACLRLDDSQNRYVRLAGQIEGLTLQIQVVNPYGVTERHAGLHSLTSKVLPSKHGQGQYIIDKLVDKYDGYIAYTEEDGLFRAKLIIPLNEAFEQGMRSAHIRG